MSDELPPWEKNRRRDLEAAMADEVPGIDWRVSELAPHAWKLLPMRRFAVDAGAIEKRIVAGVDVARARRLAH